MEMKRKMNITNKRIVDLLLTAYDQGLNEKELDIVLAEYNNAYAYFDDKYSGCIRPGIAGALVFIRTREDYSVGRAERLYRSMVDSWQVK